MQAADHTIAKNFVGIHWKKTISHIARTPWRVRDVESYTLSKFQPLTMLGDLQNVEITIPPKIVFFYLGNLFFVIVGRF